MDTEIKSRHTAFQHRLANEPTAQQRKRQERHIYIHNILEVEQFSA